MYVVCVSLLFLAEKNSQIHLDALHVQLAGLLFAATQMQLWEFINDHQWILPAFPVKHFLLFFFQDWSCRHGQRKEILEATWPSSTDDFHQ